MKCKANKISKITLTALKPDSGHKKKEKKKEWESKRERKRWTRKEKDKRKLRKNKSVRYNGVL
jgi:hypothetical protein